MNSIRNVLGMRKAGDRGGAGQPENPHSNAVRTQVHNTVNTLRVVAGDASDRPEVVSEPGSRKAAPGRTPAGSYRSTKRGRAVPAPQPNTGQWGCRARRCGRGDEWPPNPPAPLSGF